MYNCESWLVSLPCLWPFLIFQKFAQPVSKKYSRAAISHLLLHHNLVPPDPVLVVGGEAKTHPMSLILSQCQRWSTQIILFMYNSHSQSEYILKAKLYKPFYPPVTIIALAITRIAIWIVWVIHVISYTKALSTFYI